MESNLCKLLIEGDCEGLKESLNNIEYILRQVAPQGNSALHVAAAAGKHQIVKLLLTRIPCMLSMRNCDQDTPLHTAARCGKSKVVEVLLNVGNVLQCNCNSPLCLQKIDLEAESSPIQVQRIWKAQNNNGETALHYAVKQNSVEIVEMLLSKVEGISLIVNNVGESPLYTACSYSCLEIGKILLGKVPAVEGTRFDGTSCLHQAISNIVDWIHEENDDWQCHDNALNLATELVSERPQLAEAVDSSGNSPLHLLAALPFARLSHLELLEKLLNAKPEMNFLLNKDDMAPIHIAAKEGDLIIIEGLIDSAPHCSYLLGKKNKNALHFALQQKDVSSKVSAVYTLLFNSVDVNFLVNKPDNEGKSALSIASEAFDDPWIRNNILEMMLRSSPPGPNIFKKSKASSSSQQDFEKSNQLKKNMDEKDPKERLAVIAALIATISFAAGFTIPGNFSEGKGRLVLMHKAALKTFIFFDSVALSLSTMSLLRLIYMPSKMIARRFVGGIRGRKSSYEDVQKWWEDLTRRRYEREFAKWGRLYLLWSLYATMVAFATGVITFSSSPQMSLARNNCVCNHILESSGRIHSTVFVPNLFVFDGEEWKIIL